MFCQCQAVTLGEGDGKVIQYIFPDLYFLCDKYLSLSANGFDVIRKSFHGDGGYGGGNTAVENISHPRLGWLNDVET